MKTAWSDFPWGGCGHVPVRAYPPTTPPVGVARNCGAGFICPGRFGTWRVVMYSWQTDGETGQLYFPTHSAVAVCGGDLRPLGLFGLRAAARAAGSAPVTVAPPAPDRTTWLLEPCRQSSMRF